MPAVSFVKNMETSNLQQLYQQLETQKQTIQELSTILNYVLNHGLLMDFDMWNRARNILGQKNHD